MRIGRNAKIYVIHNHWSTDCKYDSTMNFTTIMLGHNKRQVRLQADVSYDSFQIFPTFCQPSFPPDDTGNDASSCTRWR